MVQLGWQESARRGGGGRCGTETREPFSRGAAESAESIEFFLRASASPRDYFVLFTNSASIPWILISTSFSTGMLA